jgi:cytochrome c553
MKKKITLVAVLLIAVGFYSWNTVDFKKFATAPPPAAKTGAPGAGEGDCTDCHGGSIQNGSSTHTVAFSGANDMYMPGQTYTIDLSLNGAMNKNGFQVVALKDADNTSVGSWTVTGTDEATMTGNSRDYIGHSASGSAQTSWNFDWTAPATSEGDITFYIISNISNNNGGTSGDIISTSTFSISENTASIAENKFDDVTIGFIGNNNEISINGVNPDFGSVTLEIFNLSGKLVERKRANDISGSFNWRLKKNHSEGIYMVSIRNKTDKIVRKLFLK